MLDAQILIERAIMSIDVEKKQSQESGVEL